jgi:pimeloyl-ACP methyl ester carboxylesterase
VSVRSIVAVVLSSGLAATACTSPGPPRAVVQEPLPTAVPTVTTTPGTGDPLAPYYAQRLGWSSCGSGFSCAWLMVPLDYAHPQRPIELAVVKLAATGARRIGSLVLNPGGPGGSGVDYARAIGAQMPQAVRSRFDIVGFDPRGVGQSRPAVRCVTSAQMDEYLAADPAPTDDAGRQALVAEATDFAKGCEQRSGDLLAHVGSVDSARDMEVLRAALGDDKLTYLGKSYGTLLGAYYADLFPTRVRALVLDGAVDPALDAGQLNDQQAVGFETALKSFLTYCVANDCPLGADPASASTALSALFASIRAHPLPTPHAAHGPLEEAHAVLGVAEALYAPSPGWPMLRAALAAAKSGDGSGLMELSDALNERRSDGSYSNLIESNTAINCIDRPYPHDLASYVADAQRLAQLAPHFGVESAYSGLTCAEWPVPPVDGPHTLHVAAAPPILVIGTTNDPATPYQWAQSLSRQLTGSVLLTFAGDGHTVYADGRSTCVDDATNGYLVDLKVPAAGTVCR